MPITVDFRVEDPLPRNKPSSQSYTVKNLKKHMRRSKYEQACIHVETHMGTTHTDTHTYTYCSTDKVDPDADRSTQT